MATQAPIKADELPFNSDHPFWKLARDPQLRDFQIFHLVTCLTAQPSISLTNEQCRSKLAEAETYAKMMFLPDRHEHYLDSAKNEDVAEKGEPDHRESEEVSDY